MSNLELLQATIVLFSLVAQYLLAEKIKEGWVWSLGANMMYAALCIKLGLWILLVQSLVRAIICIRGIINWR